MNAVLSVLLILGVCVYVCVACTPGVRQIFAIRRSIHPMYAPTVTHPDGKRFVRINDAWLPL